MHSTLVMTDGNRISDRLLKHSYAFISTATPLLVHFYIVLLSLLLNVPYNFTQLFASPSDATEELRTETSCTITSTSQTMCLQFAIMSGKFEPRLEERVMVRARV